MSLNLDKFYANIFLPKIVLIVCQGFPARIVCSKRNKADTPFKLDGLEKLKFQVRLYCIKFQICEWKVRLQDVCIYITHNYCA